MTSGVCYLGATDAAKPSSRLSIFFFRWELVPAGSVCASGSGTCVRSDKANGELAAPCVPILSCFRVIRCSLRLTSPSPLRGYVCRGSLNIGGVPVRGVLTSHLVIHCIGGRPHRVVSVGEGCPSLGRSSGPSIACVARGGSCAINRISSAHDRAPVLAGMLASAIGARGCPRPCWGLRRSLLPAGCLLLTLVPTSVGHRQAAENVW